MECTCHAVIETGIQYDECDRFVHMQAYRSLGHIKEENASSLPYLSSCVEQVRKLYTTHIALHAVSKENQTSLVFGVLN